MVNGQDVARFFRHDLWVADLAERRLVERLGIRLARFAVVLVSEFQEHALNLRAASLVYSTLLSLVPFLAVAFSLLKAFGAHYGVEPFLAQLLAPLGLRAVDLTRQVVEFVNNLRVGVLGVVGFAGLFLTVISLMEKVENAFNHIWRVRQPRSYGRMFSDYLSVVLVGPVLIFTALGLIASAESHWLVQRLLEIEPVGTWIQPVAQRLVPFGFLCVAFTFLYRVIPNTQISFTSALVGGAAGALLWQLAGIAFAALLANSARYVSIYSGFAILILFLIWLQVAWLVVLVGANVAYVHQHPSVYQSLRSHRSHGFRERTALGALVEVTRRHLAGERPVSPADLALQLNAPLSLLEDLLDDFVRRGVLLQSAKPEGVALARPPERVMVTEVIEIVRDPDSYEPPAEATPSPVAEALGLRDRAARTALEGLTLRALAQGSSERFAENSQPSPHHPHAPSSRDIEDEAPVQ
jgi:membrane protein